MEQTGTTRTNPLAMFDITIPCDRFTLGEVLNFMRSHCKRWCFQQEEGTETGYIHFQCRVSLITKKRLANAITWINTKLPGCHLSATANPTHHAGDEFYVMKEDTRIDGPWTDRDDLDPIKLQKRFRHDIVWRPWQQDILNIMATEPNDRDINVIVDLKGKNGKSFLTCYLGNAKRAIRVPAQKESRDIMRMILNMPEKSTYFIDLPRATSHLHQQSIYSAIEEIKNGYCYDDRYSFREKYFEPPHVFVFTNNVPDGNLVSRDRWKIWYLHNNQLTSNVPIEDPEPFFRPLQLQIINNVSTALSL